MPGEEGEALWFEADTLLVRKLLDEAESRNESIGEFVEKACRERARD